MRRFLVVLAVLAASVTARAEDTRYIAVDTVSYTYADPITLESGDSITNATDATFDFTRDDAGGVTLTCSDNDAVCLLTVLPGGAEALVLGGASTTSITLTTDSTGSGELVLGAGAIDGTEILDGTITLPDFAYNSRADFTICGDATTVTNNTVYYGPSGTIAANYGRACDITAVGNVTEATADDPPFGLEQITVAQVVGMDCLLNDPGATVSLTLRSAAAATTPSVTCSVADNERGCVADVQTTTAISLADTVAVAAASTSDMGTAQFFCTIHVVF